MICNIDKIYDITVFTPNLKILGIAEKTNLQNLIDASVSHTESMAIDMSKVEIVDSTILGLLLSCAKSCKDSGCELILINIRFIQNNKVIIRKNKYFDKIIC